LNRGVIRISFAPFAHSGLAFSQAVVLHPFSQSVQIVSTASGLSVSISRMNRTQRVQRMHRFRFSISVGPKSTSARTPSPSNTRRGNCMRLSFGP
jgi:hypothetical protein